VREFNLRVREFILRVREFILRVSEFILRVKEFILRETEFILRVREFILRVREFISKPLESEKVRLISKCEAIINILQITSILNSDPIIAKTRQKSISRVFYEVCII
jgi:hypothetical protein